MLHEVTSTKSAFAAHILKHALRELAGEQYFERGLAYFRSGAVSRLEATENQISARVSGTHPYIVRLWLVRRELAWNCSCPLGADGEFCKHLVATGLAWLAHGAPAALSSPELQSAKAFIEASDKQTLAEILLGWAEREDELLAELLLAAQRSGRSDPAALKDMIRSAFRTKDFIDYDEMPGLMKRIAAIPELLWERFTGAPSLRNYEELKKSAERALEAAQAHAEHRASRWVCFLRRGAARKAQGQAQLHAASG